MRRRSRQSEASCPSAKCTCAAPTSSPFSGWKWTKQSYWLYTSSAVDAEKRSLAVKRHGLLRGIEILAKEEAMIRDTTLHFDPVLCRPLRRRRGRRRVHDDRPPSQRPQTPGVLRVQAQPDRIVEVGPRPVTQRSWSCPGGKTSSISLSATPTTGTLPAPPTWPI